MSSVEIGEIHARQKGRCAKCGRALLGVYHVDHKVPLSRGGRHIASNIQLLCPADNLKKGAK